MCTYHCEREKERRERERERERERRECASVHHKPITQDSELKKNEAVQLFDNRNKLLQAT